jgi:hypothetical protein
MRKTLLATSLVVGLTVGTISPALAERIFCIVSSAQTDYMSPYRTSQCDGESCVSTGTIHVKTGVEVGWKCGNAGSLGLHSDWRLDCDGVRYTSFVRKGRVYFVPE